MPSIFCISIDSEEKEAERSETDINWVVREALSLMMEFSWVLRASILLLRTLVAVIAPSRCCCISIREEEREAERFETDWNWERREA